MAVKPKAREEGYGKDHNKGGYMWRHYNYAEVDKSLGNNIVVDDEIPQRVECHIGGTT